MKGRALNTTINYIYIYSHLITVIYIEQTPHLAHQLFSLFSSSATAFPSFHFGARYEEAHFSTLNTRKKKSKKKKKEVLNPKERESRRQLGNSPWNTESGGVWWDDGMVVLAGQVTLLQIGDG